MIEVTIRQLKRGEVTPPGAIEMPLAEELSLREPVAQQRLMTDTPGVTVR
jgi:hypothetical protein